MKTGCAHTWKAAPCNRYLNPGGRRLPGLCSIPRAGATCLRHCGRSLISSRPVEAQARVYFDQCAGDVECRADARTRIEGGVKLDKSLTAQTDFYLFAVIAALVLVHARWALPAAIIAPSNIGFWRCCVRIVSNCRFMGFSFLAAIAFTCHFAFIAASNEK